MLKQAMATIISLVLSIIPIAGLAGSKTKDWKPSDVQGQVKAQRAVTQNGQKTLLMPDGKMYLLDKQGKHVMVDQFGNKIQVNNAGHIIKVGKQRDVKLRIGPGPLA